MVDQDFSPIRNLRFPDWQREYEAALLECDPQRLPQRAQLAEAAIFLRLQNLFHSPDGDAERQAIEDAVHALRIIQTEKLNFPDWNKKE